jgi:dipeptidyl aminopeptidase/acylaminoacyl peptidase
MSRLPLFIAHLCAGGAALLSTAALAAPLHMYAGLALSPDGSRIAAVEQADEPDAPKQAHATLVTRAAADGHVLAQIDPCPACGYADPAFAADGRLAFIARDRASGTSRLMVADGAKTELLATVPGLAARPRWSPDGTQIALLVTIGASKETGATQAGARQVGEVGTSFDEQRIAVVPASGGALRLVSPADRFIYEYDWTPDGKGFVATSAKGDGDANWWVATVEAVDAASGATRTIAAPATQVNFPRVSPDGKTVAFIGGLMSDFGSVGGDIWAVPFAGGEASDVTAGHPATFTSLAWTGDGLMATALRGAEAGVVAIDPAKRGGRPLWDKPVSLAAGDGEVVYSADGARLATVAQDFAHAPAILAGPIDAPKQITHDNDTYPTLVNARSVAWQNDGKDVQGWLLAPAGSAARGKVPMITVVHGGPAAATTPHFLWQGMYPALVKAGYWLFFPNPRGSYGQGEAFTQANKRDFGGGDLKDILAGIDAVEKVAPIDDSKLGLMGGSYGGFMAMWANTQTDRFKAIVAAAGLSNWISYYGTNGINQWMIPYFGKSMYDDPAAYRAVSAIDFIKQAHTPTLITVGERDIEVPPTQSTEYFNALKAMNVPTSLVIYPDEGHGIRAPDHVADMRRRTVAWFDRYLRGNAGK